MTTQTTPATTKKPLSRIQTLQAYFHERKPQLQKVAPHHLRADRIVSIVLQAASRTPRLLECTMDSIYWCVNQSVQLGLEPASILQQFYLVPRWNSKLELFECTPVIGYKGFAELARRYDPGMKRFDAAVVYAGETFAYDRGTGQISHPWRCDIDTSKDENITAAWCLVQGSQASGPTILVLSRQQIEEHRSHSASPNVGPWKDHYPMMARKTVIRALLSGGLVGISPDTEKAIALEQKIDADPELVTLAAHEFSVTSAGPGVRPGSAAALTDSNHDEKLEAAQGGREEGEKVPAKKPEEQKPSSVQMPAEEPKKGKRGPRAAPATKPPPRDSTNTPIPTDTKGPKLLKDPTAEDLAEQELQDAEAAANEDPQDLEERLEASIAAEKAKKAAKVVNEDADDPPEAALANIPEDPPADVGKKKPYAPAPVPQDLQKRFDADMPPKEAPPAGAVAGTLYASKDKGELIKQIKEAMKTANMHTFEAHRLIRKEMKVQCTAFQDLNVEQLQQALELVLNVDKG